MRKNKARKDELGKIQIKTQIKQRRRNLSQNKISIVETLFQDIPLSTVIKGIPQPSA